MIPLRASVWCEWQAIKYAWMILGKAFENYLDCRRKMLVMAEEKWAEAVKAVGKIDGAKE